MVVTVTGWNRVHARGQLRARLRQALGRATGTVVVLSSSQQAEMARSKASLGSADVASEIDQIQQRLIKLASGKTRDLEREIQAA